MIDATRIATRTADVFASPYAVLGFILLSFGCAAGWIVAPSWNVFGAFLGMLSLAVTSAILCDGNQRDAIAQARDAALHEKIDAVIHGTNADDAKAGIEQGHSNG